MLEQVEAEPARASPSRRHGEHAELLCYVLRGLHGCGVGFKCYVPRPAATAGVKRFEQRFLASYVREITCDDSKTASCLLSAPQEEMAAAEVDLAACKTLECKGNKRDMQSFEHPSVR